MKTIGIIGSGMVGKTLAKGFASHGYPTLIGSRSEETRAALAAALGDGIIVKTSEAVARDCDTLVFAVKGAAAMEALKALPKGSLDGKTVIDATNPIAPQPPENGVLHYFTDINRSLMEDLQEIEPGAHFVKAFCSVGSGHMVNPDFAEKPTMFICGNNSEAKAEVSEILDKFGWEIEDMGGAEAARAIEPLAMLWCIPGFRENRWNHAFKLLKS